MTQRGRYSYFTAEEYIRRQEKASLLMDQYELDAILILSPENLFYLTGYTSWLKDSYDRSFACILPKGKEPVLLLPRLQLGDAEGFSFVRDIRLWSSDYLELYADTIRDLGLGKQRIGMEIGRDVHLWMSVQDYAIFQTLLPEVVLGDCAKLMYECRKIKSGQEIAYLRRASEIADKAVEVAWSNLRAGMLESDLFSIIAQTFMKEGAEESGFIILRTTPDDLYMRNKLPSQRILAKGDVISCDIGCVYHQYWSDMMRAAAIGQPSEQMAHGFKAAMVVNSAVREAARPGMQIDALDQVRAKVIAENNFGTWLPSIGHCIGCTCGEPPPIRGGIHDVLEPGMVFTIEPGVYFPPYVFNIEDVVLVTDNGVESLNNFPRELFIVE